MKIVYMKVLLIPSKILDSSLEVIYKTSSSEVRPKISKSKKSFLVKALFF